MVILVAVDENWGIGKDGDLLLRLSGDMKWFREKTIGNVIVMGRKTLESLPQGKPLPKRVNVVLTRQENYYPEGVLVFHSVEEAVEGLADISDKEICIVGGGSIYQAFLPHCKKAYVTKLKNAFEADTHMVNLDEQEDWVMKEVLAEEEEQGTAYQICVYERAVSE